MLKYTVRNSKVFKINILSFYQNIFAEMRRINSPDMILHFLSNLKNANTNAKSIILNSLQFLMFPFSLIKRNLWSYWKWQSFDQNISYNCSEGDFFFKNIWRLNLKNFYRIFFTLLFEKKAFWIAETKHSNSNF